MDRILDYESKDRSSTLLRGTNLYKLYIIMNTLEQRFLELIPTLLRELIAEIKNLTQEVKALREQQK